MGLSLLITILSGLLRIGGHVRKSLRTYYKLMIITLMADHIAEQLTQPVSEPIKSLRVTMSLTAEVKAKLLALAQSKHMTMSQIVRDAITEYGVNHP